MNKDAENIARSLELLMRHYGDNQTSAGKRCGVSQKTISNLLNPSKAESSSTLDVLNKVAAGYRIDSWMLMLPNISIETLLNHHFRQTVSNLVIANNETRNYISYVLEGPAEYRKKNG